MGILTSSSSNATCALSCSNSVARALFCNGPQGEKLTKACYKKKKIKIKIKKGQRAKINNRAETHAYFLFVGVDFCSLGGQNQYFMH